MKQLVTAFLTHNISKRSAAVSPTAWSTTFSQFCSANPIVATIISSAAFETLTATTTDGNGNTESQKRNLCNDIGNAETTKMRYVRSRSV
jgi:hypothetical protein